MPDIGILPRALSTQAGMAAGAIAAQIVSPSSPVALCTDVCVFLGLCVRVCVVCCGSSPAPNLVPVSEAGMKLDVERYQSPPLSDNPTPVDANGEEDDLRRPDRL